MIDLGHRVLVDRFELLRRGSEGLSRSCENFVGPFRDGLSQEWFHPEDAATKRGVSKIPTLSGRDRERCGTSRSLEFREVLESIKHPIIRITLFDRSPLPLPALSEPIIHLDFFILLEQILTQ